MLDKSDTPGIGEHAMKTPMILADSLRDTAAVITMTVGGSDKRFELIFADGQVKGVAHGDVSIDAVAKLFLSAMSDALGGFIEAESAKLAARAKPMETAPKDRTIRLLVTPVDDVDSTAQGRLEDTLEPTWTVGAWDDLLEGWVFVGWNWYHDCYCNGFGRVIGWGEWSPTGTAP